MPQLMRKQYLVTEDNVSKLEEISRALGCSATEVVRRAIDSYDPNAGQDDLGELVDLMLSSVKDATKEVRSARRVVRQTKKDLAKEG